MAPGRLSVEKGSGSGTSGIALLDQRHTLRFRADRDGGEIVNVDTFGMFGLLWVVVGCCGLVFCGLVFVGWFLWVLLVVVGCCGLLWVSFLWVVVG